MKIEDLSYEQKDELAATYAGIAAQERLQSSLDGVFTDLDTPNYDFEFDQDLDEMQKDVLAEKFAKNTVKQIIEDNPNEIFKTIDVSAKTYWDLKGERESELLERSKKLLIGNIVVQLIGFNSDDPSILTEGDLFDKAYDLLVENIELKLLLIMEDKDNQERLKTTISSYLNSDYWQSFEELESTSEWEEFIEELAMDI